MSDQHSDCFTDFALQEYVQGRLDPAVRRALDEHQGACTECRDALHAFTAETLFLRAALLLDSPNTVPDLSDELLARYRAGALSAEDAATTEALLTRHPRLLQQLLDLARETTAIQTDVVVQPVTKTQLAGEILRMPKRSAIPVRAVVDRRARGG